jgi:hypothetical protein
VTYNRVKPLENQIDTQLKEAMEAMLAAKGNNFIRPPSSPPTSAVLPSTVEVTRQITGAPSDQTVTAPKTEVPAPARTKVGSARASVQDETQKSITSKEVQPSTDLHSASIAVDVEVGSFEGMAASDIFAAMGQTSPPKEEDTKGKQSGAGK